jgi:TDG/mug DNA glycosylase family protein
MGSFMMREGLPDYLRPGLKLLLVGINPGLRSAEVGHHFAGPGNRFWALLHDSGITPRRLSYEEDAHLLDFGVGLTNIARRPTRSSSDLRKEDFSRGRRVLARKIARFRPHSVGFVGLTVYREFQGSRTPVRCGFQKERIEDAVLFVLPNPSGRNAHYSYRDMLRYWRNLARRLNRRDA